MNRTSFELIPRVTVVFAVLLSILGLLCMVAWIQFFRGYPLVFPLGLSATIAVFGVVFHRQIILPFRDTEKILRLFAGGYTLEELYRIRHPYSAGMRDMIDRIRTLLNTRDFLQASKKQEQFLALQNQINPHFLYNTLEGIRSEALSAGLDSVARMTEALSRFYRYTISNMDNLVSLEDELDSINTYFLIQQFRFGKRMKLRILFENGKLDDIHDYKLPKLILQPVIENAIIHGLECKVGDGLLTVRLEITEGNLVITVSDDGVGMDAIRLAGLNESLAKHSFSLVKSPSPKGGIAILNVNNRIKLLFGEQYGIHISSIPNVGTDVEILLPRITGKDPDIS